MPSLDPIAELQLPHTELEPRYAFFLEFTITSQVSGSRREIITGFTDKLDKSFSGAMAPDTVFYSNNIIDVAVSSAVGRDGEKIYCSAASQTDTYSDIGLTKKPLFTMTPADLMAGQQVSRYVMHGDPHISVFDGALMLGSVPKSVNPKYNSSTLYLTDAINESIAAHATSGPMFDDSDDSDIAMSAASLNLTGTDLRTLNFFSEMSNGARNCSGTFTFAQLNEHWPRHASFYTVLGFNGAGTINPLDTQSWHGVTMDRLICYRIAHILPSVMGNYLLVGLEANITNKTLRSMPTVGVTNFNEMFSDTMNTMRFDQLIADLNFEIIHGILQGCGIGEYNIRIVANLIGNLEIEIELNGGEKEIFCAPMFCTSFYGPMLAPSADIAGNLIQTMTTLAQSAIENRYDFTENGNRQVMLAGQTHLVPRHIDRRDHGSLNMFLGSEDEELFGQFQSIDDNGELLFTSSGSTSFNQPHGFRQHENLSSFMEAESNLFDN
jgi:hypothetical protein